MHVLEAKGYLFAYFIYISVLTLIRVLFNFNQENLELRKPRKREFRRKQT